MVTTVTVTGFVEIVFCALAVMANTTAISVIITLFIHEHFGAPGFFRGRSTQTRMTA